MLELRLFGPGRARYCDQPLTGFPSQQSCLLLCYLLLNRQYPHARERLAAVFWNEYPSHVARKNLRNALWRLRSTLQSIGASVDDYLAISDGSVSFLTSSRYWLDVEIFETAASRCQDVPGRDLNPEQAARLEQAAELYFGDLLEGIYDDWCLYDRERLRILYLDALSKLMAFHGVNGAYEHGLACGQRILAQDNSREKVHRRMMRLYALAGNRNAALAQYKVCSQVLRDELGIAPTEKTRRLFDQLLRDQFTPSRWPVSSNIPLPSALQSEDTQPFAVHAIYKLRHIQEMIDETQTELRHIERLISRALLKAKRS